MANWRSNKVLQYIKEVLAFGKLYIGASVVITIVLMILAYKDVLYLRFATDFLGGSYEYSEQINQLLIDGFGATLLQSFFGNLPLVALALLLVMVTYSFISTFRRTYDSLNVSSNYINAKRIPSTNIVLMYIALRSAAFTVPLLYWCFYFVVWFPAVSKYPLRFITSNNMLHLIGASLLTLLLLSLLTHIGIVTSRLAIRSFKTI